MTEICPDCNGKGYTQFADCNTCAGIGEYGSDDDFEYEDQVSE